MVVCLVLLRVPLGASRRASTEHRSERDAHAAKVGSAAHCAHGVLPEQPEHGLRTAEADVDQPTAERPFPSRLAAA